MNRFIDDILDTSYIESGYFLKFVDVIFLFLIYVSHIKFSYIHDNYIHTQ